MRLSDAERAEMAQAIADRIIVLLGAETADHARGGGADDGDIASIGLTAAIGVAVSIAATRCVDAAAAVALVHTLAEAAAADIYGAAG